jgi:hypothetical protein
MTLANSSVFYTASILHFVSFEEILNQNILIPAQFYQLNLLGISSA